MNHMVDVVLADALQTHNVIGLRRDEMKHGASWRGGRCLSLTWRPASPTTHTTAAARLSTSAK